MAAAILNLDLRTDFRTVNLSLSTRLTDTRTLFSLLRNAWITPVTTTFSQSKNMKIDFRHDSFALLKKVLSLTMTNKFGDNSMNLAVF